MGALFWDRRRPRRHLPPRIYQWHVQARTPAVPEERPESRASLKWIAESSLSPGDIWSSQVRQIRRSSFAGLHRTLASALQNAIGCARGTGMRAIAEAVEQSMQRIGIGTRSFRMGSGYPIIYGECGVARRVSHLRSLRRAASGHLNEWSFGPFAATIGTETVCARCCKQ